MKMYQVIVPLMFIANMGLGLRSQVRPHEVYRDVIEQARSDDELIKNTLALLYHSLPERLEHERKLKKRAKEQFSQRFSMPIEDVVLPDTVAYQTALVKQGKKATEEQLQYVLESVIQLVKRALELRPYDSEEALRLAKIAYLTLYYSYISSFDFTTAPERSQPTRQTLLDMVTAFPSLREVEQEITSRDLRKADILRMLLNSAAERPSVSKEQGSWVIPTIISAALLGGGALLAKLQSMMQAAAAKLTQPALSEPRSEVPSVRRGAPPRYQLPLAPGIAGESETLEFTRAPARTLEEKTATETQLRGFLVSQEQQPQPSYVLERVPDGQGGFKWVWVQVVKSAEPAQEPEIPVLDIPGEEREEKLPEGPGLLESSPEETGASQGTESSMLGSPYESTEQTERPLFVEGEPSEITSPVRTGQEVGAASGASRVVYLREKPPVYYALPTGRRSRKK